MSGGSTDPASIGSGENPFYHFSQKTKVIEDSAFGCRAILVNERFWNKIRSSILDLLKDAGPLVMYELGLEYGFDMGFQGKAKSKTRGNDIDFFTYYVLMSGWGRFEVSELKLKDNAPPRKATVKVHDSFFAKAAKSETGNPSCFFLSGLLAGMAEGTFSTGYNCLETKCLACGDDYCEFVLTRRPGD
ncbi:putative hydrocarbon binding protein (contains V4R domain) [Candidatus Nitrososphaera evergladensis SR1]|jgi:predicted hydrocarbon binding protein|uniref:Putative hydrocarbon binding protein (Contains V4R domain) n=1 Tax=Candidatus Nitrososphaera evergladensis SR1 TaxID=1459636 RepID=A0A075MS96_9ARCH|nr:V4R domain-containing protein [Candidatus Nitrososphaera evergladensis]AIF84441.1 putative hydrocarbon binding protein (contains V4R domain) [Candidatus Nitrososphaera evergladensis SR1]